LKHALYPKTRCIQFGVTIWGRGANNLNQSNSQGQRNVFPARTSSKKLIGFGELVPLLGIGILMLGREL
jgi:hypothetical protein